MTVEACRNDHASGGVSVPVCVLIFSSSKQKGRFSSLLVFTVEPNTRTKTVPKFTDVRLMPCRIFQGPALQVVDSNPAFHVLNLFWRHFFCAFHGPLPSEPAVSNFRFISALFHAPQWACFGAMFRRSGTLLPLASEQNGPT